MSSRRSELPWLLLLGGGFVLDLLVTWQRWNNPIVDTGREMNQPLRLLRGEMLYSDVRHIYGPLSPYLHAFLYWLFGPSLNVLYASGMVTAAALVLLSYDIARRFLAPPSAAAAAWVVLWVCVLNAGGSYVLPYSYNAVHGCVLGLVTLDLLLRFMTSGPPWLLIAAGVFAGLTVLAKTEVGLVAFASGLLTVLLASRAGLRRFAPLAARFVLPAFAVALPVYGALAARVGLATLTRDSFLLLVFSDFPPELLHFNRYISGLDHPATNLWRMLLATVRLGLAAGLALALAVLVPRALERDHEGLRVRWQPALLVFLALAVSLLLRRATVFHGLRWGDGVFRSLPLLTVVFLLVLAWRRATRGETREAETNGEIVLAFYAAASLGRIGLRVILETAETASLLPAAIAVGAVIAVCELPSLLGDQRLQRSCRQVVVAFLFAYGAWTAAATIRICQGLEWVPVGTERGTVLMLPDYAPAVSGAIDFVAKATYPGEPVACLPECSAIDFLTDRRNPLREEIVSPGYLDAAGETRTIERLGQSGARFVLVANRPSTEFGPRVFGLDYLPRLWAWIEQNYQPVATFGRDATPTSELGDRAFFIRAYRRREVTPTAETTGTAAAQGPSW